MLSENNEVTHVHKDVVISLRAETKTIVAQGFLDLVKFARDRRIEFYATISLGVAAIVIALLQLLY
ncbi:MAG: hypothetical protein ACXVIB_03785 [Halobacteriota archaeon]